MASAASRKSGNLSAENNAIAYDAPILAGRRKELTSPQSTLEVVTYISSMLRPLVDVSQTDDMEFLNYLLQMAMLHAAEIEMRCQGINDLPPKKPSGRDVVA